MSQKKSQVFIPSLGLGQPALPNTNEEAGLPPNLLKSYSPKCRACTSRYFDLIHQMIAQNAPNSKISKAVAELGEIIPPSCLRLHRKNHLGNLEAAREYYSTQEILDAQREISSQISSTKLELNATVELEHRRFLMKRIDNLLKALSMYQLKAQKPPNIKLSDNRKVIVQGALPNMVDQGQNLPLNELQSRIAEIEDQLERGNIQLVDDNETQEEAPLGKKRSVLNAKAIPIEDL